MELEPTSTTDKKWKGEQMLSAWVRRVSEPKGHKETTQTAKCHQPLERMLVTERIKQVKAYSSGKDQFFNLSSEQNSDKGQSQLVYGMNGLDLQANIWNAEDL